MTIETQREEARSWSETPPLSPSLRHLSGEFVADQAWLDKLADPLQKFLGKFYSAPRMAGWKKVLNGVWLGHPVHPAVTDIPIGAWSSTLLLDVIWLNSEHPDMARAADVTLLLGLGGAGVAAVTGLTDWSDTDATDRRVGMLHGLLNGSATIMNVASFLARRMGKRRTGIALSTLAFLVTSVSAYFGGELSYAKGIGINHVAWEGGSDDFVPVISLADLPEKKLTRVDAAGTPVVLWKEGQTISALSAICSHLGGPLDEGVCEGGAITCPWHGSRFALKDGSVLQSPAVYAQPTFAVRVRNNQVELRRLEHA